MRNINAIDKNNRTPLHYADNIENMKTLLNHGANVNSGDDEDVNSVDEEGKTPLHYATLLCSTMIVKEVVDNGVNLSVADNKCGKTALHITVARKECYEINHNLSNHGACANAVNKDNKTQFHCVSKI
ncbi:hypothetical protein KQX54_000191 [Cotesia glomerata]|uniref:Uncharacterized protein n=1 Tax=Cotesia glomerata TaxID=32391 RepID=A0AAV7HTG5_COTGL|nr:hypothetical protein KQX54_014636 [Cotesia glomerata]KAH0562010.1 hypothetical protein KQX54_000191 [Cotesia glomerata]